VAPRSEHRTLRELTVVDVVEAFVESADSMLMLRLARLLAGADWGSLHDPEARKAAIRRGPTTTGLRAIATYALTGQGMFYSGLLESLVGCMPDHRIPSGHPVAVAYDAALARDHLAKGQAVPAPILASLCSLSDHQVRALARAGKLHLHDAASEIAFCLDRGVMGMEERT
jgi:hypothetical protein